MADPPSLRNKDENSATMFENRQSPPIMTNSVKVVRTAAADNSVQRQRADLAEIGARTGTSRETARRLANHHMIPVRASGRFR
jgi:hypothetical protein